jgi:hypothetical protein
MYGLAYEALGNKHYLATLYNRGGRYLILDNTADELGERFTGAALAYLINEIRPEELILPDTIGDSQKTFENSKIFYYEWLFGTALLERGMKLMGVAQGADLASFLKCYRSWVNWKPVKVIGIPYDIEFWTSEEVYGPTDPPMDIMWGEGKAAASGAEIHARKRLEILTYLKKQGLIKKPIHLLGTNNLWELRQCQDNELQGLIRSNDTAAPFAAAMADKDFREGQDHDKDWPRLDFSAEWKDDKQVELAVGNLYEYFTAADDSRALFNLGCLVGSKFPQFAGLPR